jgi:hypothetical protein
MRPISDPIPNNLNIVWVGHNWEKHFIALSHVSEHVDHFKAIKKTPKKKQEIVWLGGNPPMFGKKPNYFLFFFLKASLSCSTFI